MATSYVIDLRIDDTVLGLNATSHAEAVETIYEKLLEHYFKESNLPGLPHPITEKDLHDAIESFTLKANFSITAA